MPEAVTDWFHVTSVLNRASITRHGLDWTRMGAARGIAGSTRPEQEGCFVAEGEETVEWFLRFDGPGTPLDVWRVSGVDPAELVVSGEGYPFLPRTVPAADLELVRRDVAHRSRGGDAASTRRRRRRVRG